MRERRGVLLAVAAALAAAGLFVALRPDGGDDAPAPATTAAPPTSAATTSATTTQEAAPATTGAAPAPVEVSVTVRGGRPVGGIERTVVPKGARVVLRVDADVADEVHVHGYDLHADVAPGAPARLAFDAALAGIFEVELETTKVHLAELEVRP